MKRGIDSILNLITLQFDKTILTEFFKDQFNSLNISYEVDLLSFENFTALPFIIAEKLFKSFNTQKSENLNEVDFINGMANLYSDSLLTRLKLIFSVIDYDNDQLIDKEDVQLFLIHYHLITNKTDVHVLLKQVDLMFKDKTQITFEELLHIVQKETSDIALLLLFFFHQYLPIHDSCIEYYENMKSMLENSLNGIEPSIQREIETKKALIKHSSFSICKKQFDERNKNNNIKDKPKKRKILNQSHKIEFIHPSQFLFIYLNINFNKELYVDYTENAHKDSNSELDELMAFENDFTDLKATVKAFNNNKNNIHNGNKQAMFITNESHNNSIDWDLGNVSYINSPQIECLTSKKRTVGLKHLKLIPDLTYQVNRTSVRKNSLEINHIPQKKEKKNMSSLQLFEMNSIKSNFFSTQCTFIDITSSREVNITIIGNMIFLSKKKASNNNNKDQYNILKMFIFRKLFVVNKGSSNNKDYDSSLVTLVCTIKGEIENYKMIFNDKGEADEFVRILYQKTNYRRFDNEYDAERNLGAGASGMVKIATKKNNKELYAVKIIPINYNKRSSIQLAHNEVDICKLLSKVNNKNIVQFYEYFESAKVIYIIMECIKGVTLDSLISKQCKEFKAQKKNIVNQMIYGLQMLNFYGIIHRDIKPENIMIIKENDAFVAKLIDFGFSKIICRSEQIKHPLGTLSFAAPEVVLNQSYTIKIDIWSLGVILYLFLYNELPFSNDDLGLSTIITNIINLPIGNQKIMTFNQTDSKIKTIMDLCLERNPDNRMTINEIIKRWD